MILIGGRATKHLLTASWASFGIKHLHRQFTGHWQICANPLTSLAARPQNIIMYMRIVQIHVKVSLVPCDVQKVHVQFFALVELEPWSAHG